MRQKITRKNSERMYETTVYISRDPNSKGCWVSHEEPIWKALNNPLHEEDRPAGGFFTKGHPMRYMTTTVFTELFGVRSMDELLMPGECIKAELMSVRMTKYDKDWKRINIKNT